MIPFDSNAAYFNILYLILKSSNNIIIVSTMQNVKTTKILPKISEV